MLDRCGLLLPAAGCCWLLPLIAAAPVAHVMLTLPIPPTHFNPCCPPASLSPSCRLIKGVQVDLDTASQQFTMLVLSGIFWFKVTERYPLDGSSRQYRRRDLRRGAVGGGAGGWDGMGWDGEA